MLNSIDTTSVRPTSGSSTDLAPPAEREVVSAPVAADDHDENRGGDRGEVPGDPKNPLANLTRATSSAGTCAAADRGERALDTGGKSTPPQEPPSKTWRDRGGSTVASAATLARFWAKVDKNGPVPAHAPDLGPCWLWTASTSKEGYGRFRFGEESWQSHRLSLVIATGERKPPDVQARHRCDNRPCVNPGHLVWGTNSDNQRDAIERHRSSLQQRRHAGAANGHAKLTADQVAEIRARLALGVPRAALATEFGVGYDAIRLIDIGKVWPGVAAAAVMPESLRLAGGAS